MVGNRIQWIGIGAWGAIVASAMVACGGGGGTPDAQGTMRFAITDAPACGYDHVWVTVEKVSVHTSGSAQDGDAGWSDLALSPAKRIDLLTLTNGVLEELGSMPLNAGHYSQVRLVLAQNTAGALTPPNAVQPTGGAVIPLATPSAQQSGLKLQVNADVAAGQMADLVLDFDACRSVVKSGNSGNYNLKPVVSVVPRTVSAIQGAIAVPALTPASTTVAAQQNGATVRSTTPDAAGNFSLPFLQPGSYTIVITSEAHATGVITGVTAGATTTSLGTGITLPASTMAAVSGAVTAASAPVTDATVRATQSLTGGPVIEVAKQPVDGSAGTYQLRLPQAAPVRAAASSTLTFTADAPVAGKYTVESTAPGRTAIPKPADVSTSTSVQVNFGY